MNIYLGPLPSPWKEPMQVKGPEAKASITSQTICPYLMILNIFLYLYMNYRFCLGTEIAPPHHGPDIARLTC